MSLYDQLAIADIQDAADVLRPVYERLTRMLYQLWQSPYLAHNTEGDRGRYGKLWQVVGRENVRLKSPLHKPEGIPAIGQLISEGITLTSRCYSPNERVSNGYWLGSICGYWRGRECS